MKKPLFTNSPTFVRNLELARELCPDGYSFRFWFNGWVRERLEAELKKNTPVT